MPYFPKEQEAKPYFCPNCKRWFIPSNTSCLVAHSPGSCCHEYEKEVGQSRLPTMQEYKDLMRGISTQESFIRGKT